MHKNIHFLFVTISLLILGPTVAEAGNFSIGGFGGYAWSVESEAIDGFEANEFDDGAVFGGSLMYRFDGGFALEFVVENYEFDLTESGEDAGNLKMTPLMLLFVYQGMPESGKGLSGHGSIGGGINLTSFSKGSYFESIEQSFGVNFDIDTDDSFIFELGGGLDYFFNKNFSMFLDARLLLGDVDFDARVSVPTTSLTIGDSFQASNFQALVGIRFWF
jgi:hypothetical protein